MGLFDRFRKKKNVSGETGEEWSQDSLSFSLSKDSVSSAEFDPDPDDKGISRQPDAISDEEICRGDVILDTYEVISDAYKGGMGSVRKVHHKSWNADLAMKRPHPRYFEEAGEKKKENFIRECEAWINLGLHPNIVSCYYVREIGGVPSVFAEWMENGSLKDRIEDGTLYETEEVQERLLDIALQSAQGLYYAHTSKGHLVHQDVKPDNILLTKEWEAKVADFGLARARAEIQGVAENAAQTAGYTPAYGSPEQLLKQTVDVRSDIYSWAVSVMEMYLGKRLWKTGTEAGKNCRTYFGQCRIPMPEELKELLGQCMENDPEKRPSGFGSVIVSLKNIYEKVCGQPYPRKETKASADTADSLNNRALSFLDLGKPEEAENAWLSALESEPGNTDAVYNRGLYMWRTGRIDDLQLLEDMERLKLNAGAETDPFIRDIRKERGEESHFSETDGLPYEFGCYQGAPLYQLESGDGSKKLILDTYSFILQDERSGKPLREFQIDRSLYRCAVSKDGGTVVYAHAGDFGDIELHVYSIPDQQESNITIRGEKETLRGGKLQTLGISAEADRIYIGLNNGTFIVLDKKGKKVTQTEADRYIGCMYVDPDTGLTALGTNRIHLYDKDGKEIRVFPGRGGYSSSVFLRGERLINAEDFQIRIWDITDGKCLHTITSSDRSYPFMAAWIDEEGMIHGIHGKEQSLYLFAEGTYKAGYSLSRPQTTMYRLTRDEQFNILCEKAESLIRGGKEKEALAVLEEARKIEGYGSHLRLLDLNALAGRNCVRSGIRGLYPRLREGHQAVNMDRAVFSRDGNSIFSIGKDAVLCRYDLRSGELLAQSEKLRTGNLLAAGNGFIAAERMGTVRLFDSENCRLLHSFQADEMLSYSDADIKVLRTDKDCRLLAAGRNNGQVSVWDLEQREQILQFYAGAKGDILMDISPDGSRLLTAGRKSREISVWEIPSGKLLYKEEAGDPCLGKGEQIAKYTGNIGFSDVFFTADPDCLLLVQNFPLILDRYDEHMQFQNLFRKDLGSGKQTVIPVGENLGSLFTDPARSCWGITHRGRKTLTVFLPEHAMESVSWELYEDEVYGGFVPVLSDESRYMIVSGSDQKLYEIDWIYA